MSKKVFLLITVVFVLGLFSDAMAVPPTVVHEWKFDGNAQDSSGNNNHGTMTGFVPNPWVTGIAGQALDFDGSDDTVDNLAAGGLPTSRYDPWSMNVWLYIPTGSATYGDYRGICSHSSL